MPEVKINRNGEIVSIKSQRNYEPKQEITTDFENHSNFKKVIAVIGTLALAASIVYANIVKPHIDKKQTVKQVEKLDLNASKDQLLKDTLDSAYKAFHAPSNGYSNPDEAYKYFEGKVMDAAKKGENISVVASQIRAKLWDKATPADIDAHQNQKEANIKETEKALKGQSN